ncbi:hypothetical protein, partial [Algoriphagus sediminis]
MENISQLTRTFRGASRVGVLFLILFIAAFSALAQTTFNPVVFTPQTNSEAPDGVFRIRGDFSMIGNKNLTATDPSDEDNGASTPMSYVDIDGINGTVNSSSADLVFATDGGLANPNCYEIVHAGLYWTGRTNTSSDNGDAAQITVNGTTLTKNQVKLRYGNGAYQTVTAKNTSEILFPDNISDELRGVFAGYADVTDFVKNNGSGTYTVADIFLRTTGVNNGGSTGLYGGWGMVVIYKNPTMSFRNISTFNGYSFVNAAETVASSGEFTVSGFEAIDQGPVNVKLGVMGGEGDKGISGDDLSIRNSANTNWVRLQNGGPANDGGNSLGNFFNSSIFTEGNTRFPDDNRNYGLDLHVFDLPNTNNVLIDNGDNQTRFRYRTNGDTYVIFNLTFAVDAYEPEIEAFHQVTSINNAAPAGTIKPGEIAEFTVELTNKSTTEGIDDGILEIQIPFGATVENTSFSFNGAVTPSGNSAPSFDPNTGILSWEFGSLPLSSDVGLDVEDVLATFTYELKATEDCLIIFENTCTPDMNVDGVVKGTGAISQSDLNEDFIIDREPAQDACSQPSGLTGPIEISYDLVGFECETILDFEFCGPRDEVTLAEIKAITDFADGYTFFDGTDRNTATEFTEQNPFPATVGTETYYAFPFEEEIFSGCYTEFTISVSEVDLVVTDPAPICEPGTIDLASTIDLQGTSQGATFTYFSTDGQTQTELQSSTVSESGTYVIRATVGECFTEENVEVVISPLPTIPNIQVIEPTCEVATGEITFAADQGVEYAFENTFANSLVPNNGIITVSGLAAGSSGTVFARTIDTDCVVSENYSIGDQPETPAAPTVEVIQPTCEVATGTITVTAPVGQGLTYSIGGAYQASATFT